MQVVSQVQEGGKARERASERERVRKSPGRSSPRVQVSSREVIFPRARMLAHPTKTEIHEDYS